MSTAVSHGRFVPVGVPRPSRPRPSLPVSSSQGPPGLGKVFLELGEWWIADQSPTPSFYRGISREIFLCSPLLPGLCDPFLLLLLQLTAPWLSLSAQLVTASPVLVSCSFQSFATCWELVLEVCRHQAPPPEEVRRRQSPLQEVRRHQALEVPVVRPLL